MLNITEEEIMKNWGANNFDNPLLSIKCMTYNHKKYIAQCIEGFLIQKTNFPFEILIHDDCSTDGTDVVIKEYESRFPKIIKAIYETENQWQKGGGAHHKKIDLAIKGKYIAFCEGDDYWIDENKLQMQVDFFEGNPEYGMCYTKAKPYNQSEKKFSKKTIGGSFTDFEDLLVNSNRVPTLTTVYRKDLLNKYQQEIQPNNKGWLMGDYPMWLYFSHESKVKFINEVTAVYRVLEESASHSVDVEKRFAFFESIISVKSFFSSKYDIDYLKERDYFLLYSNEYYQRYDVNIAKLIRFYSKSMPQKTIKEYLFLIGTYNRFLYLIILILKYINSLLP